MEIYLTILRTEVGTVVTDAYRDFEEAVDRAREMFEDEMTYYGEEVYKNSNHRPFSYSETARMGKGYIKVNKDNFSEIILQPVDLW